MNSSATATGPSPPRWPWLSWCFWSGPSRSTSTTARNSWRPDVQDRPSPLLLSVLCVGIAILYIPILVLIGYSFNASSLVSVWGGFSTSWYRQLMHNDQILDAAWLSLEIGVVVSTGAVILGTLAAIALVRFSRFRGRLLLTGMVNAPLVMPEIITGITQLLLFISMLHIFGWPHRGFITIVIAHIAFC